MEELYYHGLKFSVVDITDSQKEQKEFILAENFENDYIFQIICISGYNSGKIFGYVKEEESSVLKDKKAITKEHLLLELKKNIIFDNSSFLIIK